MLLIGVAVIVCSMRYGPPAWNRSRLLYHQRQCLRYTAPADQVVFDTDPQRVAALWNDPHFTIVGKAASRNDPDFVQYLPMGPRRWLGPRMAGSPGSAILFLHERTSPDGQRYLVLLERIADESHSPYFIPGYDVDGSIRTLADWRTDAVVVWPRGYTIDVIDGLGPHPMRLYAGQPDPADASHFTIRYESQGKGGVVDGYVRNGGALELKRRE